MIETIKQWWATRGKPEVSERERMLAQITALEDELKAAHQVRQDAQAELAPTSRTLEAMQEERNRWESLALGFRVERDDARRSYERLLAETKRGQA